MRGDGTREGVSASRRQTGVGCRAARVPKLPPASQPTHCQLARHLVLLGASLLRTLSSHLHTAVSTGEASLSCEAAQAATARSSRRSAFAWEGIRSRSQCSLHGSSCSGLHGMSCTDSKQMSPAPEGHHGDRCFTARSAAAWTCPTEEHSEELSVQNGCVRLYTSWY